MAEARILSIAIESPCCRFRMLRGDAYYLNRGLRRVAVARPAEVVVAFDLRVDEVPHRSRNAMLVEAVLHFMACDEADWDAGDQLPSPS